MLIFQSGDKVKRKVQMHHCHMTTQDAWITHIKYRVRENGEAFMHNLNRSHKRWRGIPRTPQNKSMSFPVQKAKQKDQKLI